jgi:hypothetical protein
MARRHAPQPPRFLTKRGCPMSQSEGAPCLASFARRGIPQLHPSEDLESTTPGRPRLQPSRKPTASNPCCTAESGASAPRKVPPKAGLQPRWTCPPDTMMHGGGPRACVSPTHPENLKTRPHACINHKTDQVPDTPTPAPTPQPRGPTIIAAGLLLAALALVVLYTSRKAFLSPVALVVVAAIGVAALLLQRRLRPNLPTSAPTSDGSSTQGSSTQPSSAKSSTSGPLWLNILGLAFAIAAVSADLLHLNPAILLIAALAAVASFATSAVIVLNATRNPRP